MFSRRKNNKLIFEHVGFEVSVNSSCSAEKSVKYTDLMLGQDIWARNINSEVLEYGW